MRTYDKDIANAPKRERISHSRYHSRWRALFNWAYMRKYLKSQVGRPWNDVWADIAATHDVRNYSDAQFREEVKDLVYFDVYINEDGMFDRHGGRIFSYRCGTYYVDAEGILKAIPQDKRYRHVPPESKIIRINGLEYYKHDGIWYEVVTKPLSEIRKINLNWMPGYSERYFFKDAFGYYPDECDMYYHEKVACISKRQVGKRVINRINKFLESKYYD